MPPPLTDYEQITYRGLSASPGAASLPSSPSHTGLQFGHDFTAAGVLARYPLRRVAMIGWPGAGSFDRGLRTFRFRGWRDHQFTDWADPSRTDRQFTRRMLAEEWPGIAFELPPGHDDR